MPRVSPKGEASKKLPIQRLVSAGGVVYRENDAKVEVVICGREHPVVWGLPKGTPNQGETLEETALREVGEETGLKVAIAEKIGTITYWFVDGAEGIRYHKTVHHYLMTSQGGDTSRHDDEYDLVSWLEANEACRTLSYRNEVDMVRKAMAMVKQKGKEP